MGHTVDLNTAIPVSALKLNEPPAAIADTAPAPAPAAEAPKPETAATIAFTDFEKLDLRVGKVTAASRVEQTDKLIQMQVDFGSFQRQIVAGVGKLYTPEQLVGHQYAFVVNLAPRKLRGVESHGMLLAAGDDTALGLATLSTIVAPGTRVG